MARYGFDLDGTLTKPAIRDLANHLYDAGHEIYVVTGGLAEAGEWTEEERLKRLDEVGVRYTKLIRCIADDFMEIGRAKGRTCAEFGIEILFDDAPVYLAGAAEVSAVQCVLVG